MALDLIVQHVHSQLEKVTIPPSYLFCVSDKILLIQLKIGFILVIAIFTDYKYWFSLRRRSVEKCLTAYCADKEDHRLFSAAVSKEYLKHNS